MEGRVEARHVGQAGERVARRPDRRQRDRVVERGEAGDRRQSSDDGIVDEDRGPERLATVDDAMADRRRGSHRRAEPVDELAHEAPVVGIGRSVGPVDRGRGEGPAPGRVDDAGLERARPGVDDEGDPGASGPRPGAHPGQRQSRISGTSSPTSRV